VTDLRSGRLTGQPVDSFVLLLQEAYRSGADVPSRAAGRAAWASAQRPPRTGGTRDDIVTIARRLKLAAFYVPSMRNGAPDATGLVGRSPRHLRTDAARSHPAPAAHRVARLGPPRGEPLWIGPLSTHRVDRRAVVLVRSLRRLVRAMARPVGLDRDHLHGSVG